MHDHHQYTSGSAAEQHGYHSVSAVAARQKQQHEHDMIPKLFGPFDLSTLTLLG